MKILISNDCGKSAHYWERMGLARAFTACGHECVIWDIDKKSEFDAFDEFEPDLFIGQTYRVTQALVQCIKERPALKVILKAADAGKYASKVGSEFPILLATTVEKRMIQFLKDETDRPNFLFIHYHPDSISYTHEEWIQNGYQVESLMNAADIFSFTKGVKQEKYECDIMFLGGYWPYKAQVLDKWILPLCQDFKYKIKIFGNSQWPCPQYCGFLPEGEEANALASAKICINLHEPHSQKYGFDIVERPFKLMSNKCFMVTDSVAGLEKLYYREKSNNEETTFNCYSLPGSMHDSIEDFLKHWDNYYLYRQECIKESYDRTMENHTYFNRAEKIMSKLGLESEANKIAKRKLEVFAKMEL